MNGAAGPVVAQLLTGKVGLLLGASRGIGEAIARAAYVAGARLVIGSRDFEALAALAQDLDPSGDSVVPVRVDMTDRASLEHAVSMTAERFGRFDIAFNNAGHQSARTSFIDTDDNMFDDVMAVNLRGVFVAMKWQVRAMLAAGNGGAIVNTSSILGMTARPLIAPYVASKHGLIGLTKVVAIEMAPSGIRANCVAPGPVMTEMLRRGPAANPEALQKMLDAAPMARLGTVDEVASAAVWLASDASSYVTGVTLPIDGGVTIP
ncbi:short chain dehydrogenase [Sphingobium sp. BS19]|nr:short chain dehydrogenase [Sphingobium sp. BS19]